MSDDTKPDDNITQSTLKICLVVSPPTNKLFQVGNIETFIYVRKVCFPFDFDAEELTVYSSQFTHFILFYFLLICVTVSIFVSIKMNKKIFFSNRAHNCAVVPSYYVQRHSIQWKEDRENHSMVRVCLSLAGNNAEKNGMAVRKIKWY